MSAFAIFLSTHTGLKLVIFSDASELVGGPSCVPLVSAQKLSWFCRSKQNNFLLMIVNMDNGNVGMLVKESMKILQSAIKIISFMLQLIVFLHCCHE